MQQLNFQQIWRYREQLWQGLQVTLELTAIAVLAGLAIGLAGALLSRHGPVRRSWRCAPMWKCSAIHPR